MIACPDCGSALEFDVAKQKLKCPSCRQEYGVTSVKDNTESADTFNVFRCSQCGGEVYSNDNTIAGFCSYCGAPAVRHSGTDKIEAPHYIIPFKVDKEGCKKIFEEFVDKNNYVPNDYRLEDGIHEFRGIYVPYHVYDAEFDGAYHMKGRSETVSGSGDKKKCNVKIWDINAVVSGSINKITHDASDAFDDDQSELINDNCKEFRKFAPGYLCGFYADSADVPAEEYTEFVKDTAYERAEKSVSVKMPGSIKTKSPNTRPDVKVTNTGDVLKPVWFMAYRNNNRMAYSVINGKTGKISCDLPVDIKWFFGISLAVSAVLFIVLNLLQGFMLTAKSSIVMAAFINLTLSVLYNMNISKMYDHEIKHRYKARHTQGAVTLANSRLAGGLTAIAVFAVLSVLGAVAVPMIADRLQQADAAAQAVNAAAQAGMTAAAAVAAGSEYRESGVSFKVAVCAITAFIQIIMISVNAPRYAVLFKNSTKSVPVSVLSLLATAVLIVTAFINPVDDIWYYIVVLGTYAVDIFTIFGIIRDYNLSCTRPLPQFELYKGGREHDRD